MKKLLVTALCCVIMLPVCSFAEGTAEGTPTASAKAQTTCPVMGGSINKKFYADYQGKRVYFCCPSCRAGFLAEPEKYLQKLTAAGVVPEAAPAGGAAAQPK